MALHYGKASKQVWYRSVIYITLQNISRHLPGFIKGYIRLKFANSNKGLVGEIFHHLKYRIKGPFQNSGFFDISFLVECFTRPSSQGNALGVLLAIKSVSIPLARTSHTYIMYTCSLFVRILPYPSVPKCV